MSGWVRGKGQRFMVELTSEFGASVQENSNIIRHNGKLILVVPTGYLSYSKCDDNVKVYGDIDCTWIRGESPSTLITELGEIEYYFGRELRVLPFLAHTLQAINASADNILDTSQYLMKDESEELYEYIDRVAKEQLRMNISSEELFDCIYTTKMSKISIEKSSELSDDAKLDEFVRTITQNPIQYSPVVLQNSIKAVGIVDENCALLCDLISKKIYSFDYADYFINDALRDEFLNGSQRVAMCMRTFTYFLHWKAERLYISKL